ncbi:MAG: 6-phosphogluconolactonase [Gemmatimonadaceae bacterium]
MPSRPEVLAWPPAEYPAGAATQIAGAIRAAIARTGHCHLALTGGDTPRPVYAVLASLPVEWGRVTIWFGDERRVPPDDPASNFRMARETLLDHLPVKPAAVHPMDGSTDDPWRAARDYANALPPALDVLLLGVGADGHTASLFPGAPTLAEQARRVVPATSPVAPHERLTITAPVIAAAHACLVLATGARKRDAVARALAPDAEPRDIPAALARPARWLLDTEAAARLPAAIPATRPALEHATTART